MGIGRNQLIAYQQMQLARSSGAMEHASKFKCVDCGRGAIVWDHRDYLKPLDVVPVCSRCNALRGEGKNKGEIVAAHGNIRVPEKLYARLKKMAAKNFRSVNSQVIVLIERGLRRT